MALQKHIISENGIIMEYHRIDHFETLDNSIILYVKSYADKSYRDKEVKITENCKLANDLRSKISEEMAKEGTNSYDKEMIRTLTDQANELGFPSMADLSILTRKFEYSLDRNQEFSFKTFYMLLKSEELFKDSEDVIE